MIDNFDKQLEIAAKNAKCSVEDRRAKEVLLDALECLIHPEYREQLKNKLSDEEYLIVIATASNIAFQD
jgi:hypothetical protein